MMVALCDVPLVVADFVVSDLDWERVERRVVYERMTVFSANADSAGGVCGCPAGCQES
jgi:hypothetical protein